MQREVEQIGILLKQNRTVGCVDRYGDYRCEYAEGFDNWVARDEDQLYE